MCVCLYYLQVQTWHHLLPVLLEHMHYRLMKLLKLNQGKLMKAFLLDRHMQSVVEPGEFEIIIGDHLKVATINVQQ